MFVYVCVVLPFSVVLLPFSEFPLRAHAHFVRDLFLMPHHLPETVCLVRACACACACSQKFVLSVLCSLPFNGLRVPVWRNSIWNSALLLLLLLLLPSPSLWGVCSHSCFMTDLGHLLPTDLKSTACTSMRRQRTEMFTSCPNAVIFKRSVWASLQNKLQKEAVIFTTTIIKKNFRTVTLSQRPFLLLVHTRQGTFRHPAKITDIRSLIIIVKTSLCFHNAYKAPCLIPGFPATGYQLSCLITPF